MVDRMGNLLPGFKHLELLFTIQLECLTQSHGTSASPNGAIVHFIYMFACDNTKYELILYIIQR